jgi:hypothetical protein
MITLKTLSQATEQEVFDQVKDHLLKQGKQANSGFGCLYKTEDGLKCAAGCFIADDEYSQGFEGFSWATVAQRVEVTKHAKLISGLQSIHDTIDPEHWAKNLKAFANNWKLKYE